MTLMSHSSIGKVSVLCFLIAVITDLKAGQKKGKGNDFIKIVQNF